MPWHRLLDRRSELRLGALQIGTTRRGIGPAYADKAARVGIRVQDLLDAEDPAREDRRPRSRSRTSSSGSCTASSRSTPRRSGPAARPRGSGCAPYIADTSLLVDEALRDGEPVLCEGAQGTLLDLDHGTYPFVTSSNPIAGGACIGLGIGPDAHRRGRRRGQGVPHPRRRGAVPERGRGPGQRARCARPAASSARSPAARGAAAGSTSSALRYAARVNGFTELVLTKLDVLSALRRDPVCVAYRLRDGSRDARLPGAPDPTSTTPSRSARRRRLGRAARRRDTAAELPDAARRYVEFVERELGVEVALVGAGRERERALAR